MADKNSTTARCLAYLEKLPNAISGSGGHAATLRAAQAICRFGLTPADEAACLDWFNAVKCSPVWTAAELAHKLEDARRLTSADKRAGMYADKTPAPAARPSGGRKAKTFTMPTVIPKFAAALPSAAVPVVELADPVPDVPVVPDWNGGRVLLEDWPAFKAKHGLAVVRMDWPAGGARPVLVCREAA